MLNGRGEFSLLLTPLLPKYAPEFLVLLLQPFVTTDQNFLCYFLNSKLNLRVRLQLHGTAFGGQEYGN